MTVILGGLLALAQDINGFDDENVTYCDWAPLDSGQDRALIFEYMSLAQEYNAFKGELWCDWTFKAHLYTAYDSDIRNAKLNQDDDREAVMAKFRNYPQLRATPGVFHAFVNSSETIQQPIRIGEHSFLQEDMTLVVREDVSGTELE